MTNPLKDFLHQLVKNRESFRLYKEGHKCGSTSLMLYLAVRHAYAGRRVLLLVNDDSSTWQIAKQLHFCIESMVGPDDIETVHDIKDKIKMRRLMTENVDEAEQNQALEKETDKVDVVIALNGSKPLKLSYAAGDKTVILDAGINRWEYGYKGKRPLYLGRTMPNRLIVVDGVTGQAYEQPFDFDKMKFIEEEESC